MKAMKRKKEKEELEEREIQNIKLPGVDGKWGWFVVFNAFICNMIVDGTQFTFSNFLQPIVDTFHITSASASLIGSLLSGFYNFSGPIAGALGNKFGFRMVAIMGSFVSSISLMVLYFAPSIIYFYVFYGILGGLGFGMIYMASVITTSIYFDKYRALAASLSVCGTGVGTFAFAPMGDWLVETLGWRYALVVEGGVVLLCILCGLSFKPLAFISVVPISREPSYTSSDITLGTRNESIFYPSEEKKTHANAAYPTFREALQEGMADTRRNTLISVATRSNKGSVIDTPIVVLQPNIFSMVNSSRASGEKNKYKRRCRICCFNFWHCRRKYKDLNLGDRPLYRDDIFYGGSLTSLRPYSTTERMNYHLSVTRVPNALELEEHVSRKCCVCHQAFVRTCLTMTGINLLKSGVFVFLCISSFFYTMSLYIPYVFIRRLAKQYYIAQEAEVWLVSAIGISNTAGRLISGIIKSFCKVNAAFFVFICLFVSGSISFVFFLEVSLITLFTFCCVFGMFTAPFISLRPVIIVDFLGLEKLTNAFGLVLLSQGVASILGPPLAGLLEEKTGRMEYTIYLSGMLMLIASFSLLVSTLLHGFRLRKAN